MALDFLWSSERKILRTTLYNDQEFSTWELELLHTPIVQRLYGLKQLGFADRVFPDAVHSRLNHVLGVAEMAERMADRLAQWLRKNATATFAYARDTSESDNCSITGADLAEIVTKRVPVVRMIGLLHDLTHAAYGHTLEDEVCVFKEKHDDPARQCRFFDALVAQLLNTWVCEVNPEQNDPDVFDALFDLDVDESVVLKWTALLASSLSESERKSLALRLRELELAFALLTFVEFLHEKEQVTVPQVPNLLVSKVVNQLDEGVGELDLVIHRDAFLVDIVGNTICADLLDYARRDAQNAGLRVQFDDRLIRYLCTVSVEGVLSPTSRPCIRLAIQFYTDKIRHDVLSEMSGILKARYLITERVLYHPTKCAAGAMLGTVVQMLGVASLPSWVQVLGDQEFIRVLVELGGELARRVSSVGFWPPPESPDGGRGRRLDQLVTACLNELAGGATKSTDLEDVRRRLNGARSLLFRLMSRRYPKLAYRLRGGVRNNADESDDSVAKKYADPLSRYDLERQVEVICNLPPGSLVIHCPRRKMSMKVAQALVVGIDLKKVAHLRDVDKVTPEPLGPYHDEIIAVENMYRSIWQLHAFLDPAHEAKRTLVAKVLAQKIHFPNDRLLANARMNSKVSETPFDLLAGTLETEYASNQLPAIVRKLDSVGTLRMRQSRPEPIDVFTRRIISEVQQELAAATSNRRVSVDGMRGGKSRLRDGAGQGLFDGSPDVS